ncbi:hypothetical protein [Pelomonas sp. KK5]|nr:hypothetical protein [Pelomonas sp. KK5]
MTRRNRCRGQASAAGADDDNIRLDDLCGVLARQSHQVEGP